MTENAWTKRIAELEAEVARLRNQWSAMKDETLLCQLLTYRAKGRAEAAEADVAQMTARKHELVIANMRQLDELTTANKRAEVAEARVKVLEGALAYYQDTFCEGFCSDVPPGYTSADMELDCSGCKARAARNTTPEVE